MRFREVRIFKYTELLMMNRFNSFKTKRIATSNFLQGLLLSALLVFFSYITFSQIANATLVITPPGIRIAIYPDGFGHKIFKTSDVPGSYRINLGTTNITVNAKQDLYIGVIEPEKNGFYSWTVAEGAINFSQGLLPISRGLENDDPQKGVSIHEIKFQITGYEPLGLYWVFAVLVAENGNPHNPEYWSAIAITPFFINTQEENKPTMGLFVDQDLEVIADSIIIFKPDVDIPATTVEELVMEGEILKVEKGIKPDLIIRNANTLVSALKKGVVVRMFLKKHLERDAYYPIAIFPFNSEAKL